VKKRVVFLLIMALAGLLGEFLLGNLSLNHKFLAGAILLLVFFTAGRKVLSQYQTAALLFAALSLAVAYSTFLSHSEIYYSFWFNFLLSSLFLSVASCLLTLKPSTSLHYLSFLVFHISVLVVALGFVINAFGERRCYLPLHRGEELHRCLPIVHGKLLRRDEAFPMAVKLQDFRVDYYSRAPVLGVFLRQGEKFNMVKGFELRKGRRYFGARFLGFQQESRRFEEKWGKGAVGAYPLGRISPSGWVYSLDAFPGMLAVVDGKRTLYYLPEKEQAVVLPDFAFVIKGFSDEIPGHNPPVKIPVLVLEVYSGYGTAEAYLAEGDRGLRFGPYSLYFSTSQVSPRVLRPEEVLVKERELKFLRGIFDIRGRRVVLVPGGEPFVDGKFAYRLMRPPVQEKEYASLLLVDGREFRVRVNSPAKHGGYTFYQSDYDPSDPDFSGIMAVREPGELVLYLGFSLMALGALLTLAYRRRTWR